MKERFAQLSIVSDVVTVNPGADANEEYDDEYDDTYDDNAMGEREPDLDEVLQRRSFVLPQALGGGHIRNEASPDDIDEGESGQEGADGSKPKPFCRNPAEIRAEAERKRAEKTYRSNRAADKKKGGRPAGVKDVVGNAKGQGQDKQVLINRARKNA